MFRDDDDDDDDDAQACARARATTRVCSRRARRAMRRTSHAMRRGVTMECHGISTLLVNIPRTRARRAHMKFNVACATRRAMRATHDAVCICVGRSRARDG